ncbi:MAG: hypothetical protein WCJ30_21865, partial [Deltaproteobacteria bacterium]
MRPPTGQPVAHAALLLAMSSSGCVYAATTVIPNPITHAGVVSANRIASVDSERAGYYAVTPTAFANEASLLVLDAQRACFAVTLRVERANQQLTLPQRWRVF